MFSPAKLEPLLLLYLHALRRPAFEAMMWPDMKREDPKRLSDQLLDARKHRLRAVNRKVAAIMIVFVLVGSVPAVTYLVARRIGGSTWGHYARIASPLLMLLTVVLTARVWAPRSRASND